MASYASAYPEGAVFKKEFKKFFEEFYQISDMGDAHGMNAL